MENKAEKPCLTVLAGPNGSRKSSLPQDSSSL